MNANPTTNDSHEWLFVLADQGTSMAAWWLKIRNLPELAEYMARTNDRFARAFQNYADDPDRPGHGPNAAEAALSQTAWLRGANRDMSMIASLIGLQDEIFRNMACMLETYGQIYVNSAGGYCMSKEESGTFCHRKDLVWPQFTESDIRITRFPDGRHWYARIGNVEVRNGDRTKFDDYTEARSYALKCLTD